MKRIYLFLIIVCGIFTLHAQQFIYSNLQDLLEGHCNEVDGLVVEKRTKNQIVLNGGADYRITKPEFESMNKYLRHKCYAVMCDSSLYVNCKHLRFKRMRFGNWYSAAMIINGNVFFCAMPLGSAVSQSVKTTQVTLGGNLGDALASSGLVHKRVYYMIDGQHGHIVFVGKDFMSDLLQDFPELLQSYHDENSELADVTQRYLLALSEECK